MQEKKESMKMKPTLPLLQAGFLSYSTTLCVHLIRGRRNGIMWSTLFSSVNHICVWRWKTPTAYTVQVVPPYRPRCAWNYGSLSKHTVAASQVLSAEEREADRDITIVFDGRGNRKYEIAEHKRGITVHMLIFSEILDDISNKHVKKIIMWHSQN